VGESIPDVATGTRLQAGKSIFMQKWSSLQGGCTRFFCGEGGGAVYLSVEECDMGHTAMNVASHHQVMSQISIIMG